MSVTEITREFLLAHPLPEPEKEGDKQARGRVLVIAGSVEIPGAALLAGLGSPGRNQALALRNSWRSLR